MKKIAFLSLVVIALVISSCGSKEKDQSEENASGNGTEKIGELVVEFKTTSNDKFKVYYSKDANSEIGGELFIDKYIYGSAEMQKIVFKFPEGEYPYKIRLDVGVNQKVENLTIKNITFKYGDKSIEGDEGEFMKYWSPNECIKYDDVNFVYNLVPSANGIKSPVFMANIDFQKKLRSLNK